MIEHQISDVDSPQGEQPDEIDLADGTGLDPEDSSSSARIVEPFDPTLIRVNTQPMTIDLLLSRIRNREINLNPGFQRKGGIWTDGAQSRLVESLLIRIPLPAFYFDATDEDCWLVVDGLQRLTTIKKFVLDKSLTLQGMEFLANLEGLTYEKLPRPFQRRIQETQVTVYLIDKGTPPEVKFNIFKRINTTALPLSAQEIRHALYQGKATTFLEALAKSESFQKATDRGIRDDRMGDRECVLRFLAFTLTDYTEYRAQELEGFLNEAMKKLNGMSDIELDALAAQFQRTMQLAYAIFGRYAFRKQYRPVQARYPINRGLFEAWSVGISRLSPAECSRLRDRQESLTRSFCAELRDNREFESAITQGTGDIRKVRLRFATIERLIASVLK